MNALLKAVAICACLGVAARAETAKLAHAASLYADAKEVKLRAPAGVACTADGRLVVADSGNGRLLTLAFRDGAFSAAAEVKLPQLGVPVRVQIDSKGDVLALDARGRRIARVGLGGQFRGYVEPTGVPGERALVPVAFRLDAADRIVLLDAAGARVVVLDPAGAFVRQLRLPRGSFLDVAVDARGTLYAVDAAARAVWSAPPGAASFAKLSRRLDEAASHPAYAAVTERGLIVVVDSHGGGLVMLGPDGSFLGRQLALGWTDGALYYPAQICIDGKGDVFVADRNNDRVQAFVPGR